MELVPEKELVAIATENLYFSTILKVFACSVPFEFCSSLANKQNTG